MSPTRYPSFAHRKQTFKRAEAELNRGLREAKNPTAEPTPTEIVFATNLLPDIPGFVHGIVAVDPVFVVQCDGCGRVAVGELDARGARTTHVIQFSGIQFRAGDERRLCATCRVAAGWDDYDTQQCRADAKTLAFHEAYMREAS